MTNNEFFKELLSLTTVGRDTALIQRIFELGERPSPSSSKIRRWREYPPKDNGYSSISDDMLKSFIRGFYRYRKLMLEEGKPVFNFPVFENEKN